MKKTTDTPAYSIGDRVVYCGDEDYSDSFLLDAAGTVIFKDGDNIFGVEFDERHSRLHDCGGHGTYGHCWWCRDTQLMPTSKMILEESDMGLLFA